ncbi:MAG: hypothetical protein ACR2LP_03960, partial [Candidatus Limnocylindrales bacterium]
EPLDDGGARDRRPVGGPRRSDELTMRQVAVGAVAHERDALGRKSISGEHEHLLHAGDWMGRLGG